ncbi:MAG: glycosyltransferase family 2 protein [bacterium]|nr:glycosyltransferase family 2 protein [Candidatus Sumerlaeota bacterium]
MTEPHDINDPQQGDAIRLSVIIINLNTRDFLHACLTSMKECIARDDFEVILVDNGSTDDSVDMVRRDFPRVRVLPQGRNLGFTRANNIGLMQAKGQYLLVLNSDTEMVGNALGQMCDYMDAHPDVGALGSQLLNNDGSVQLSCRSFPSFKTVLFHRYSLMTRLFPRNRYSAEYLLTNSTHGETMDVDWVSGACLLTRRETTAQVGLLDEGFFIYAEDVDWCYRMKQAGWRIVYFPNAKVLHHIGRATSKIPYRMIYERHRSMWRFYRKHYSKGIVLIDVATWLGVVTRCGLTMARSFIQRMIQRESRA